MTNPEPNPAYSIALEQLDREARDERETIHRQRDQLILHVNRAQAAAKYVRRAEDRIREIDQLRQQIHADRAADHARSHRPDDPPAGDDAPPSTTPFADLEKNQTKLDSGVTVHNLAVDLYPKDVDRLEALRAALTPPGHRNRTTGDVLRYLLRAQIYPEPNVHAPPQPDHAIHAALSISDSFTFETIRTGIHAPEKPLPTDSEVIAFLLANAPPIPQPAPDQHGATLERPHEDDRQPPE